MKILISLSRATDWFSKLSQKEQKEYVAEHPRTKLKVMAHSRPDTGTKTVDGKRVLADGSPLPDHISKLTLPPAWTDVVVNSDPQGSLLATGKDAKGRSQFVYSEAFSKTQAEAKFRRIEELLKKSDEIFAQNEGLRKSGTVKQVEAADCLKLIMITGLRPGSTTDTKAKVQAYGATTLKSEHVVETDKGLELHFVGKKGISLQIPVTDPDTAAMLRSRVTAAGKDGNLFNVSDKELLDHTHTMDGGGFKTKDFRTRLGTSTAMAEVKSQKSPKTMAEYKKAVSAIAKTVSTKLGNTPTVALQSYINPIVFAKWFAGVSK